MKRGMDTAKEKVEIKTYCPKDLSKIQTIEGALARQFNVAELSSSDKINLQIRGYVDFYGGYAEHTRNIMYGLDNTGKCKVKLIPIKSPIDIDPFELQKSNNFLNPAGFNAAKSIFLNIAGPGWMQEEFLPKHLYKIGWTMIESVRSHPDIIGWLKNLDEIWCPTQADFKKFNQEDIIKDMQIMHLGYDNELFHPDVKKIKISNLKGKYVFGVLGSWNKRKGIKQIIRAFCKAFKGRNDVALLMVCKYGTRPYKGDKDGEDVMPEMDVWDIEYEFKKYTADLIDLPQVNIIDIPIHPNILPNLIANFDCLVGCSMGESTWLPGLQSMGMKKPVIQLYNEYAGYIDYMNHRNSYLCMDMKLVEADDELVKGTSNYYIGQEFYEGSEDDLGENMKQVRLEHNTVEQYNMINEAYRTVQDWTWKESVKSVLNRLEQIDA